MGDVWGGRHQLWLSCSGIYDAIVADATNGSDGSNSKGSLIDGKGGSLYGTCAVGGTNGSGTIFKITPNGVLTSLYSFTPGTNHPGDPDDPAFEYNADGIDPNVLLLGCDWIFYGGQSGSGSVFLFTRSSFLNVLHLFNFSRGEGQRGRRQSHQFNSGHKREFLRHGPSWRREQQRHFFRHWFATFDHGATCEL
jgi:uncharacterized repeat protein (TIGR03803 family)